MEKDTVKNVSALPSVLCGTASLQLKSLPIKKSLLTGPTRQPQVKVSRCYNTRVNSEVSCEAGCKKFLISTLEHDS